MLSPLNLDPSAFVFVEHWLEEAFAGLGDARELYYDWAIVGQTYAALNDYPPLDERLWDLENRVELSDGPQWKVESTDEHLLKFAAFIAAYVGDAESASIAWEKLGQFDMAAAEAREAGDLERAYALWKRTTTALPEELTVAVKLLRLGEQLRGKYRRLQPAERRRLADQLQELATLIAAGTAKWKTTSVGSVCGSISTKSAAG